MEEIFVRYLHFLGIITLASALLGEHLLISKKMDSKSFKKLVIVDAIYGMGAIATLVGGVLLWFVVGKPAEFYSTNLIFHIKLTAFLLIGLISIFPTVYFLRNRKAHFEYITLPKYIIKIVRIELCLLVILPLLATLIARGVGTV
jgi:putative membrane protein